MAASASLRGWPVAAAAVATMTALTTLLVRVTPSGSVPHLADHVRTAGAMLALMTAAGLWLHWRATGQAFGARACAAGAVAAVGLGLSSQGVGVRIAMVVAVAIALGRALLEPDVDTTVHPLRELAVTTCVLAGVHLLLLLFPDVLRLAAGTRQLTSTLIWTTLMVVAVVRARTTTSVLLPWAVPITLGLALASAVSLSPLAAPGARLVSSVALLGGFACSALGTLLSLATLVTARREEVHATRALAAEETARFLDVERERAHEARNALLLVEGATHLLRRHDEALAPDDRDRLEQAIVDGLAHVRRVVVEEPTEPGRTHDVAALVRDRIRLAAHAAGTADDGSSGPGDDLVEGAVPGQVRTTVVATDTCPTAADVTAVARILDNLLHNATVHGTGPDGACEIDVHVERLTTAVLVRVRDHGPGVADHDAEHIFERGVRLHDDRPGDGLGLYLSRQLAHEHGGDLWVDTTHDGPGACFVLQLPAAGVPAAGVPAASGPVTAAGTGHRDRQATRPVVRTGHLPAGRSAVGLPAHRRTRRTHPLWSADVTTTRNEDGPRTDRLSGPGRS